MTIQQDGLIFALLLDGKGGAQELDWQGVLAWTPEQGPLWVHCIYDHTQSRNWLEKDSGLDPLCVMAMTDEEVRPRASVSEHGLLLFLRAINTNPGHDPEDMVSLRLWLDKNRMITTRKRRLLSVQDVKETLAKGQGPKSVNDMMTQLIDRVFDRVGDLMDDMDMRTDQLEETVIQHEDRRLRIKISEIRREAIVLRRYLAPQREAFLQLSNIENNPWITKITRLHVREMTERLMRYVEDLDMIRERAVVMQEDLLSRISEQMDRRMYVLSMVAVIFLPLTFITGLLGINVDGIPGAQSHGAFWWVVGALAVITGGMLVYFKKHKWI